MHVTGQPQSRLTSVHFPLSAVSPLFRWYLSSVKQVLEGPKECLPIRQVSFRPSQGWGPGQGRADGFPAAFPSWGPSTGSSPLGVCHLRPCVLHSGERPAALGVPWECQPGASGLGLLLLLWVLPESSSQDLLPGQVMSSLSLGVCPHLLVMVLRHACLSGKLGW